MEGNAVLLEARSPYIAMDTRETMRGKRDSFIKKTKQFQLSGDITCLCSVDLTVWIGEKSGKVTVLDESTGDVITVLSKSRDVPISVMCVARGYVWVGYSDGVLRVYHAISKELVNQTHTHSDNITDIVTAPNSDVVYSSSLDSNIRYWNTNIFGNNNAGLLGRCGNAVRSLALFNNRLFSGGDDSRIIVWNTTSKESEHVLEVHSAPVLTLLVFRSQLWSGAADGTVCIWNLNDVLSDAPECVHMITNPHEGSVTSLKTVGLKVWSVSAGQIYVWNPSSFELEMHCRLGKDKNITLNMMETVTQVVSSKTWISYRESGDISILQSDDTLSRELGENQENFLEAREKEELIIKLLQREKALSDEIEILQLQLAELKCQQEERSNVDLLKESKKRDNRGFESSSPILTSNLPTTSSKIIDDNTDTSNIKNKTYRQALNNIFSDDEHLKGLEMKNSVRRYVVVDAWVLLEKLNSLREEVGKLIESDKVVSENSCLYFTVKDGSPPLPIGSIALDELTEKEREEIKNICGCLNPPFVVPLISKLNSMNAKQNLRRIIRRVRLNHCVPSSAPPNLKNIIYDFVNSIYLFNDKSNDIFSGSMHTDDIGYPPISFYLNDILHNITTEVQRGLKNKQLPFDFNGIHGKRTVPLSRVGAPIESDKSSPLHMKSHVKNYGGPEVYQIDKKHLFAEGFPDDFEANELHSINSNQNGEVSKILEQIYKVKRLVVESAAHSSSRSIQACTMDLFPSLSVKNFSSPLNELTELGKISCKLVKRLCHVVEKIEVELGEQKKMDSIKEKGISTPTAELSENTYDQTLGLFSLLSQMHENDEVIHELLFQCVLNESRRIAIQYGRLMDALLLRHQPFLRPSISWDDIQEEYSHPSSSSDFFILEALHAYNALVEKVHTMEEAFFGV
ncbi:WD40 repeat [Trypanosoma melophagium]|uniref:WD40 repeat n=1 Tax=Trypanosoma melophagium TaxID=715481 RepID=UPI00351A7234|nr:WD40 repeat [Trypanosoma melophagium]